MIVETAQAAFPLIPLAVIAVSGFAVSKTDDVADALAKNAEADKIEFEADKKESEEAVKTRNQRVLNTLFIGTTVVASVALVTNRGLLKGVFK